MIVLGIDTCSSLCGVAIVVDNFTVANFQINIPNYHDEKLVLMIRDILNTASLKIDDIDAISVAIGPGSFTGIRIGMSAAKGLAISQNKPIIGVSTLDALAYKMKDLINFFNTSKVCSVIDAKRDEVYFSIYNVSGTISRIYNYECKSIVELGKIIDDKMIFIGDAVKKIRESNIFTNCFFIEGNLNLNDPSLIAIIGYERLVNNLIDDANHIEPMYIKEFNPKKN